LSRAAASAAATCKRLSAIFFPVQPPACAVSEPVEVDPGRWRRVLCHCHWAAGGRSCERLTVVLVHGLEGRRTPATFRALPPAPGRRLECRPDEHAHLRSATETLTPRSITPTFRRRGRGGAPLMPSDSAWEQMALVGYSMGRQPGAESWPGSGGTARP